jgi:hypothetical protein
MRLKLGCACLAVKPRRLVGEMTFALRHSAVGVRHCADAIG